MIGQEWSRGDMRVRNLADMHGRHTCSIKHEDDKKISYTYTYTYRVMGIKRLMPVRTHI